MIDTNIISWNIRGICNEVARSNCKRLLLESRAQIILIQESKCSDPDREFIALFWESMQYSYLVERAIGLSGGLMIA